MHLAGNQIAACQSNLRNLLSSLLLYCGNLSHWHPLIWRLMGLCTKLLPAHTYIYKHIRTCIYYVYMFAIFKRKKNKLFKFYWFVTIFTSASTKAENKTTSEERHHKAAHAVGWNRLMSRICLMINLRSAPQSPVSFCNTAGILKIFKQLTFVTFLQSVDISLWPLLTARQISAKNRIKEK